VKRAIEQLLTEGELYNTKATYRNTVFLMFGALLHNNLNGFEKR